MCLRKKYRIVHNVTEIGSTRKYTIIFKRTKPGDFRCLECMYGNYCNLWVFNNNRKIIIAADICITYPRTSNTKKTRHYYSPSYVIKEI